MNEWTQTTRTLLGLHHDSNSNRSPRLDSWFDSNENFRWFAGPYCMVSLQTTFGIPDPTLPIHYNRYGATMTIMGSLHVSIPLLSGFQQKIFPSPVKTDPKNAVFRENEGLFFSKTQKAHPCMGPRLSAYFAWRSVWGPRLQARRRISKKENEYFRSYNYFTHDRPIGREKNPGRIWINFALGSVCWDVGLG